MTNLARPRAAAAAPGPVGAGRYAPSPSGDLHLGHLRTAVVDWLFARSTGRRFLLRFEDLDTARVRLGVADRQQADLTALGSRPIESGRPSRSRCGCPGACPCPSWSSASTRSGCRGSRGCSRPA